MTSRPSRTPSIPIPPASGRTSSSHRNLSISEIIHLPNASPTRERHRAGGPSAIHHHTADASSAMSSSAAGTNSSPITNSGSTSRSLSHSYIGNGRPSHRSWTANAFEPRIVRGASHSGAVPHVPDVAHSAAPSTSPMQARRMSTPGLRASSFTAARSPSIHHAIPHVEASSQTCPVPRYLENSSLRHLLHTEEHDPLPPNKYFPVSGVESGSGSNAQIPLYLRGHRSTSSVSDSDDDELIRPTPTPPFRASPTPAPPSLDTVLKLPTRWSDQDRQSSLSVSNAGRDLAYNGMSREDQKEAGAARADHPIPPACGIYYFETKIVSKGLKGHISIGLCTREVRLTRLPGWEKNSWGYHGDDGNSFSGEKNGSAYGPTFGTGDVIGCGIDFSQNRMFYTKNGVFLGMVFENVGRNGLYPCIGMRTQGESIHVNFGLEPFRFDIDAHFVQRRNEVWARIQSTEIRWTMIDASGSLAVEAEKLPDLKASPPSTNLLMSPNDLEEIKAPEDFKKPLNKLVIAYLAHHGYAKTAQALQAQVERDGRKEKTAMSLLSTPTDVEMETDDRTSTFDGLGPGMHAEDVKLRTRIVNAVTSGDIDTALQELRANYPAVLSKDDGMMTFKLRCQKFVELVVATGVASKKSKLEEAEKTALTVTPEPPVISDGYDADVTSAMEVDEEVPRTTNGYATSRELNPDKRKRKISARDTLSPAALEYQAALASALSYGRALQSDYRKDTRPEVQSLLKQAFNLVAFEDPLEETPELREVVGQEPRARLANELNLGILESQGRPSQPTLERIYRQVNATILQLGILGVGAAAFADVRKEFIDS